MPPIRQSLRDLSQVPTRVTEHAEDGTQPVVPFVSTAPKRAAAHELALRATEVLPAPLRPRVAALAQGFLPNGVRQTLVGVGRLHGGYTQPPANPPVASSPAVPVAARPAAEPQPERAPRVDHALRSTLELVSPAFADASNAPRQKSEPVARHSARHPPVPEPQGSAATPKPRRMAAPEPNPAPARQPSAEPEAFEPQARLDAINAETGLFRKAAVQARRADGGLELDFSTGVKARSWSMLLLLLSLVGLLFAGAALASIEVTAEASGVLRAPNGLRPVASVLPGSITEVLVRGGDVVEPGQVVARLEATELRVGLVNRKRELSIVRDDVTSSARHDRQIEAQSAGAMQRRRAALKERIDVNAERVRQRQMQNREVDALVREGGASRVEGMNAKEALQEASELVSSLGNDLALLDLEIADRARLWQERESARRTQLSRAEAGLEEAEALLAATEIRSPGAGRIESLLVSPGAVVAAGGVLANIVPSSAPRTIVGFVSSREIAFIVAGASARVEVLSLPVSEFGLAEARVTRVSTDVATPAEVQAALGEVPKDLLVRVELELCESQASPKMDAVLRSGERVNIRLHRRQRRLITLLFDFVRRWVE